MMNSLLTRSMGALMLTMGLCATASAQTEANYPTRNIEVIVPYAAGGGVDVMARTFADEASRAMGQQWVILNREGAGGVIGFSTLARAKPDGYTIAFSPASPMTNAPFINANMPFRNDQIEPVCQVFENVFAIAVKPDSPIKSFPDLMEKAKAQPGRLAFGHAGPASVGHLSLALIERETRVKFNQVPYRGDSPAMNDLMSGTLDFAALGVGTLAGKNVRVLAVLSAKRHPALPDVPSITEFGAPANSQGLNGLYVPAGTPKPVIERIEAACQKVAASPAFADRVAKQSQVVSFLNAQAFKSLINKTYATHEGLVPGLSLNKN
ncbi:tripartite tricarboxylate transporter substrate binding protein [Ottowia caeni]|uniref:Bug family tripartite tricarboxylate transporter substrate binding protein n=1 Tax=Ottowia caeni TaxID=2870339 RepID=UPI001E444165|nr:tripartite tricarboxylate transporter substrate binding protein [Ottowia caeni]